MLESEIKELKPKRDILSEIFDNTVENPLISIVIPLNNEENSIKNVIEAILNKEA